MAANVIRKLHMKLNRFLEQMVHGDSIELGDYSKWWMRRLSSWASQFGKKHDPRWRFTTRKVGGKIRIWRTQ